MDETLKQEALQQLLERAEEYEAQGDDGKAELCRDAAAKLKEELK